MNEHPILTLLRIEERSPILQTHYWDNGSRAALSILRKSDDPSAAARTHHVVLVAFALNKPTVVTAYIIAPTTHAAPLTKMRLYVNPVNAERRK